MIHGRRKHGPYISRVHDVRAASTNTLNCVPTAEAKPQSCFISQKRTLIYIFICCVCVFIWWAASVVEVFRKRFFRL